MQIALFDPALKDNTGKPSDNLGDVIIQQAVLRELKAICPNATIAHIATHSYPSKNMIAQAKRASIVLAGGSNLIGTYSRQHKNWHIRLSQIALLRNRVLLMGVGWSWRDAKPGLMASLMLKVLLNKTYMHSVRDSYTQQQLARIGIRNVLNTGCPTMWPLASLPANAIPIQKSNDALIMLTDWAPDVHADKALINLVAKHYRQMHIWFQGEGDEAYFARIANELSTNITTRISTIPHRLIAFEQFLTSGIDFDYIGTRLHGGVRCLLGKHRSLIIAVDHRAVEIANDTRLSVAQRNDLTTVAMWIDQPQSLQIQMPQTAIDQWRHQLSLIDR